MAKRFFDTELDDKAWFNQLSCRLKCAVQFVFRKCDNAGIWEPNYVIAAAYVGEGGFTEAELLTIDNGEQFEKLPNGKIFVAGFCDFQYGQLSENCNPHKIVIQKLKKQNLYERVVNRVPDRVPKRVPDRVQEKDKDKDKEKETDMEKDKDFGKSENLLREDLIIPQMAEVWKTTFPSYTFNRQKDFAALGDILRFMMDGSGNHDPTNTDLQIQILNTLQKVADEVKKDQFWTNKPLKSIASHIQEFYNKIKNAVNGKPAGKKYDDDSLKRKVLERYGKGRQGTGAAPPVKT